MADPVRYCLMLLKGRMRSRHELDQAMERKGFEQEDRQQALEQLVEFRLIDDLLFAKAWVRNRDSFRPRGASVLRQELLQKGIGKDIISQVLSERKEAAEDENEEQLSEFDLARQLIKGKERLYAPLAPEVRKRRLMGLLQRRGFSYDVIRRILEV
jgi:regulatory protein